MVRRPEYLVVDLETVPDDARWARPDDVNAFPPTWAHQIVVIGTLRLDSDYRLRELAVVPGADEPARLVAFSRSVTRRTTLVTYNGRAFDLPVIALRALCHGVPVPWHYRSRSRFVEDGHLDVCDWLADHGATRAGSLDAIARLCGLPGKVGVDGSQVDGLYQAGEIEAIERYCLADVVQTALVFLRFRLLQGVLAPAAYGRAIDALLLDLDNDPRVADLLARIDRAHLHGTHDLAAP